MLLDSCQRLLVMDLHHHVAVLIQTHLTDMVGSERQRLIRIMTGHKQTKQINWQNAGFSIAQQMHDFLNVENLNEFLSSEPC